VAHSISKDPRVLCVCGVQSSLDIIGIRLQVLGIRSEIGGRAFVHSSEDIGFQNIGIYRTNNIRIHRTIASGNRKELPSIMKEKVLECNILMD
jgi:hypothetical protein